MIPVFRISNDDLVVGPFRVNLIDKTVKGFPWFSWMEEKFPHGWMSVDYVVTPFGGAWGIIGLQKQGPDAIQEWKILLFIGHRGELLGLEKISVLKELKRSGIEDFRLQRFGDWLWTGNRLYRKTELFGDFPIPPNLDLKRKIQNGSACLGPEGRILFTDGNVLFPNGDLRRVFDLSGMMKEVIRQQQKKVWQRVGGWREVLGWDENQVSMMAVANSNNIYPVILVDARRTGSEDLEVQRVILLYSVQPPDVFRLGDGGWLVQAVEKRGRISKKGVQTRWLFRLPGSSGEIEERVLPPVGHRPQIGFSFTAIPEVGLVALVNDEKYPRFHPASDKGEQRISLLVDNGQRAVWFDLLKGDVVRPFHLDEWKILPDQKDRVVYLVNAPLQRILPPKQCVTPYDFVLAAGPMNNPTVKALIDWKGIVVGVFEQLSRTHVVSFRIQNGFPVPIKKQELFGYPHTVESHKGDDRLIIFLDISYGTKHGVIVYPDGEMVTFLMG